MLNPLRSISYPRTRALAAATAVYGVYAAAKPEHLPQALGESETGPGANRLPYTYAARDLTTSALGIFGPGRLIPVAAALRIAGDAGDATVLGLTTQNKVRVKVIGITLGWGAINAVGLALDLRARR